MQLGGSTVLDLVAEPQGITVFGQRIVAMVAPMANIAGFVGALAMRPPTTLAMRLIRAPKSNLSMALAVQ